MSVEAYNTIWKHSNSHGAGRLIMLAIADHCDEQFESWPRPETVMKMAKISERAYHYAIKSLIDLKELEIVPNGSPHRGTLYRVLIRPGGAKIAASSLQNLQSKPDAQLQNLQQSTAKIAVKKRVKSYVTKTETATSEEPKQSYPSINRSTLPTVKYPSDDSDGKSSSKTKVPIERKIDPQREDRKKRIWRMLMRWNERYLAVLGTKYAQSKKDFRAIKGLIDTGLDEDHIFRIAEAAWNHQNHPRCFNCKNSASLTGLFSKLNEIRAELNMVKNLPVQPTGGQLAGEPDWKTEKRLREEVQSAEAHTHYDHDKTPDKLAALEKSKENLRKFLERKQ